MKIEDVEVGMKVKLLATLFTDIKQGYLEDDMLSVGDYGEVVCIDYEDNSVKLSDGFWYSVKDLKPYKEPYTESRQNTNIGNLTVSISLEDKQEIAKDILKIVLKDFNGMKETIYLLSSKKNANRLLESVARIKAGHDHKKESDRK